MAAIPNQTNLNFTTPFFALSGSGGGGGGGGGGLSTIPLALSTNSLVVSTISNTFGFLGASTTTYAPVSFRQSGPIGSQLPRFQMKLRQDAADAGAIVSLEMGTDYKNGTSYINSVWDGFILMPMLMNIQDLTINDETGLCMYVNNQVTQVPQLSTINVQTNTINGAPYPPAPVAPATLSTSSNYSASFTFNPGSNVTLHAWDFGSLIPAGDYNYTMPISFNASNSPGVTSLILGVYGGGGLVDSNTTCIFSQKTNDYVFYTLRGQIRVDGTSPAVVVAGTSIDSFDVDVSSYSGTQTAYLEPRP